MRKWLIERFLPMWAKETVLRENRRLQQEKEDLTQKNRILQAYIRGLRTGLRGREKGGNE